jgi:MFS transporter, ACS family, D-galactonate transporter
MNAICSPSLRVPTTNDWWSLLQRSSAMSTTPNAPGREQEYLSQQAADTPAAQSIENAGNTGNTGVAEARQREQLPGAPTKLRRSHGNVRWTIAALLFVGIVINYFDRVNLSVAAKPLQAAYGLSAFQYGIILSSFLWSYALLQIPVGQLLDSFGVKWLVRIGTILWSLATFMTAIVSGMGLIILARVLLGAAEAPAFPGASKATGYWFPLSERGLATSSFDAAAKFSNVIGVPIVAWAVTVWGWRGGFWLTGVLSALFAIAWWVWYRDPQEKKGLSREEYDYIRAGGAQQESPPPSNALGSFKFLLTQSKIWGMTIGFAAYGYSFYLLLTWLPGYLQSTYHMTVLKSGWYTIVPWAVATVTDLIIGGWLVDRLIRAGHEPTRVRKTLIVIGMLMGLFVIGAAFTRSANVAIVWITIALAGLAFAAPIGWSIPALVAPNGTVGMVGSIMNFFNNVMGILAPIVTGAIVLKTGSFAVGFIVAAVVLAIGIICYVLLLGDIRQIELPERLRPAQTPEAPPATR